MARILVTGAHGFVGAHLRRALASAAPDSQVVAIGGPTDPPPGCDLTDTAAMFALVAEHTPNVVVHLAAQASVGALRVGATERTWAVNLGGTLNLALALARYAPHATLLFASSSEIYGRSFGPEPVDEETPPQPANAYARSKLLAERVLADALPEGARLIVARPFNHTGPGQREDFVLPSFAAQIARIERGLQPPILEVGNLDVQRDFLDVRDVVRAYLALIAAAPRLPSRFTCNIATGGARPLRDVLARLQSLARAPFEVQVDPARRRAVDGPYAAGRAARLADATGWAPEIALETTLEGLLATARERLATPVRA